MAVVERVFWLLQAGEKVVAYTANRPLAGAGGYSHLYSDLGHRLGALPFHVNDAAAAPRPGPLRLLP